MNTSVNEKVDTFNRTILNMLSNFSPHEIIVCDDKDPPWLSNRIKTLIQEKAKKGITLFPKRVIPTACSPMGGLKAYPRRKKRYHTKIANRLNSTQKSTKI